MRNRIVPIIVLAVIAIVFFGSIYHYTYDTVQNHYESDGNVVFTQHGSTYQKYWNQDFGLSFAYRINPDGYTVVEIDPKTLNSTQDMEKFLVMYNSVEYKEWKNSTVFREAPQSISVRIYKNPHNLSVQEWISLNAAQVSYKRDNMHPQNVAFGGANGLRFYADGLYRVDTVILSNNYKIYVLSGQYDSPEDRIHVDFLDLLNTLTLF